MSNTHQPCYQTWAQNQHAYKEFPRFIVFFSLCVSLLAENANCYPAHMHALNGLVVLPVWSSCVSCHLAVPPAFACILMQPSVCTSFNFIDCWQAFWVDTCSTSRIANNVRGDTWFRKKLRSVLQQLWGYLCAGNCKLLVMHGCWPETWFAAEYSFTLICLHICIYICPIQDSMKPPWHYIVTHPCLWCTTVGNKYKMSIGTGKITQYWVWQSPAE